MIICDFVCVHFLFIDAMTRPNLTNVSHSPLYLQGGGGGGGGPIEVM